MITTSGLRVVFGRTVALDRLDVTFREGVTGLFGPNGSGKSTLLRTLCGLQRPSAGGVELEGRGVDSTQEDFRRRIGFAGHEPGLYARLTVIENLELFARLCGAGPRRPQEMIDRLGLGPHAGKQVVELSAGLKRRAAVARALLHEPDVLLLDEPYANLDDEATEAVSAAVRAWRGPRRAAVIATHGAKKLKAWADAGVILRDGRLVTSGSYRRGAGFEADEPRGRGS